MPTATDDPLRFDDFELHAAERQLRVRGQPVSLGSRAFDLLLVLAQRHERLVTKQELLDLVWPGLVVEEHNIATQVGSLRKLLGAQAIATLPGYGYRLTARRQAPAPTPDAPPPGPRPTLPDRHTRFIGREAALADLARLVPATRLLTLTGIGGCGKTRLALRFAQQQAAAYADGVCFVDLAPLQHAGRVAAACAAVWGLPDEGDAPLLTRLREHLAARHLLLVLDNCEHVIEGAAALAEALLAGPGRLTILATSREALGVSGEQLYPVRSLSLPTTDDLGSVLATESARVFVDRARLLRPDFEVDAAGAAPLAEICRRLDGIALALELAAARVTMLSIAEIAQRLDDRFRLLTGGHRAVPRHQTLRAAMQWSYEQLTAAEQRMLRQVAVFAGGWTLQAAADVAQTADDYEALALLTALHDKSLLTVDRDAAGGAPRYRMLETVRQYALERLAELGEADAARGRHVAHFIAMAEEAEPQVRGPGQDAWMGRFKQEHENLVVALGWCCEGALDPQPGLRLAAATGYYWGWNSVESGYRLTRAVLDHDRAAAATPARQGALLALTRMSEFRGRYEEALTYAQQALAAARQIGAPQPLAWALNAVGSALGSLGRDEASLQAKEEALALARQLDDGVLLFTLLNNIGSVRHRTGQLEAAERCYVEALAWARGHVGRVGQVVLLDNLIRVLVARGELQRAREHAAECLPLARDEKVGADLLEAAVGLASRRGEHATAARFWGAADRQLLAWGYRHEPGEMEHVEPLLAASRQALGDAAFDAAEAAGRAADFSEVMRELERWLAREG
ncbi:winged helix-turn-helix domain-containing protein [uncultured Methylibium sp.]|uniref:ATP-binding protein n=1 Tax=uncultured Methylibium sp. TaxID=381093 RepID=UPI0025E9539A|nr:winged helix-turn-helix domain-containing protein [uncultured Methylibium sp.]